MSAVYWEREFARNKPLCLPEASKFNREETNKGWDSQRAIQWSAEKGGMVLR
jgi:hypothetical protein